MTTWQLLSDADAALYRAKAAGRNRVAVTAPPTPAGTLAGALGPGAGPSSVRSGRVELSS